MKSPKMFFLLIILYLLEISSSVPAAKKRERNSESEEVVKKRTGRRGRYDYDDTPYKDPRGDAKKKKSLMSMFTYVEIPKIGEIIIKIYLLSDERRQRLRR